MTFIEYLSPAFIKVDGAYLLAIGKGKGEAFAKGNQLALF